MAFITLRYIIVCAALAVIFISPPSEANRAHAGTADAFGNSAELYSITITPGSVLTGSYPVITGFAQNTSSDKNGSDGKGTFTIIAVISQPNKTQKTLLWNNVNFSPLQKKSFTCTNIYDISQTGTYKVEYSIYDRYKKHRYSSLSRNFAVTSSTVVSKSTPTAVKAPVVSPQAAGAKPVQKGHLTGEPTKPKGDIKKETGAATKTEQPAPAETFDAAVKKSERYYLAVGGFVNASNSSAGANLMVWPLHNWALQGTYGSGTFTSYEARTFVRFPVSQYVNPYLGAGFLHTERKADILGVNTVIAGSGPTVFAGLEVRYGRFAGYADISGNNIKLEKTVTSGTSQAKATVEYSPVTICIGATVYLF